MGYFRWTIGLFVVAAASLFLFMAIRFTIGNETVPFVVTDIILIIALLTLTLALVTSFIGFFRFRKALDSGSDRPQSTDESTPSA
jgi:hypothetical protein